MPPLQINSGEDGVLFRVRVVPRARKNEVCGWQGEVLKVRLTAPPVKGAANKALVDFLAKQLGVRKNQVEIVSGHTAREKTVRVRGVSVEEIQRLAK